MLKRYDWFNDLPDVAKTQLELVKPLCFVHSSAELAALFRFVQSAIVNIACEHCHRPCRPLTQQTFAAPGAFATSCVGVLIS